jgi:hypothetical protein
MLRCPRGHQWAPPAGGPAGACPVCGSTDSIQVEPSTLSLPLPRPPAAPDAPPALEGFEILEELGRGGMGIVYKARQRLAGPPPSWRTVALKVIRPERLTHPETLARFRREAQAAARLSHPNVVAVYGADQAGDVHYLAMEFVPGVTLQRLVDEQGPLPVARACDFVRQAALGLQHAADMALVHRDVKPANLMAVIPPGGPLPPRPLIKLLDLGVARLAQLHDLPEDTLTTLTRDGAVIGTPDYVAPEQLEDPRAVDIRADLYSLGCTFYFLLAGHVPFPGGTLLQKLDRQRWQTPPSVDQLRPEVPKAAAAVVRRLMAKHPDDRYAAPGELAAALEQLTRTGDLPRGHQPAPLRELLCLLGSEGPVVSVACTPDGRSVLAGGGGRVLRLWGLAEGRELKRFGAFPHEVGCVATAPDGRGLSAQGATVRVWDLESARELLRLSGHTDVVRAVSVSADSRLALTGGDDRTLRLWDLGGGRELQRLTGHKGRVSGAALSADGRLALSGDRNRSLRLWDARAGRELRRFAAPPGAVLAVALAPDGRTALSGHFDTTLRLWDVETGRELRRLTGHRQMVSAVAFRPDGRRLASAGHDGTVRLWDPDSGAEVGCCQGHDGPVYAVAFTPDGRMLLSAGADRTVRLWPAPE